MTDETADLLAASLELLREAYVRHKDIAAKCNRNRRAKWKRQRRCYDCGADVRQLPDRWVRCDSCRKHNAAKQKDRRLRKIA